MEWVDRAWSGEERLGRVFWKYGLLYQALLVLCISIISGVRSAILALKAESPSSQHSILWMMCGLSALCLYSIWWALAVWKCRNEAEGKFWKYPAIIIALVWAAGSCYNLVGTYTHRDDIPIILNPAATNACVKIMFDYAEKYHVDPTQYMTQNRDYMNKCIESYTPPKAK